MSNLICENCDCYIGLECKNLKSENYKVMLPEDYSCDNFTSSLAFDTTVNEAFENKETIDHPNHYNIGGIEVIDFIESWDLKFSLGNAIKYIARAPYKNNELEDLKKARWYIDREIQRLEKNTNK